MELTDIELDNFLWLSRNTKYTRDEIISKIKARNLKEPVFGEFVLTSEKLEKLCKLYDEGIENVLPEYYNRAKLPEKYKEILNCRGFDIIVDHRDFYKDIYDLKFTYSEYCDIFNPPAGLIYEIHSEEFWNTLPDEIHTIARDSNKIFYAYGFGSGVFSTYENEPKQYWGWKSVKEPLIVDFMKDKKFFLDCKHGNKTEFKNRYNSFEELCHRPNVKKAVFDFNNIDWNMVPKIYDTIKVMPNERLIRFSIKCTGSDRDVYYPWQGEWLHDFGYEIINMPTENCVFKRV